MPLPLSRSCLLSLLAAVAVAAPCLAVAQQRADDTRETSEQTQEQRLDRRVDRRSLSAAVRRVTRDTQGQVLSAERVQFDGRDVNRIKMVDDRGRVRVYWDDPQAGHDDRRGNGRAAPARQQNPRDPRTRRDDSGAPNL